MARSEKWLVYLKTGVSGPHDQAGLSELFQRGQLTAATRIKPANGQRWLIISQVPEVWQPLKAPAAATPKGSTPSKQTASAKQKARPSRSTQLADSDELFTFDDPLEESSPVSAQAGAAPVTGKQQPRDGEHSRVRNEAPGITTTPGGLDDPLSPQPPVLDPLRKTFASLGPGDYLHLDTQSDVLDPIWNPAPTPRRVKRGFFEIPSEPSQRVVLILLIILLGPFLLIWVLMLLLAALNGLFELLEPSELALHRGARGLEVATLFATDCNGRINLPDVG